MMKKRSTRLGLAAIVVVAALVAATVASASRRATPIKLMVIAAVATPIQNYPDAKAGAEAAAAAINKAGGVKGRPIEIEFCNTQSQANVATACDRQAVADGVVAVVGHSSTLTTLEEPILQQGGVPDVGLFSFGNAVDWTNPNVFPLVGGVAASYMGIPFAMKQLHKKRFVIFYQDVPSAQQNAKNAANAAKAAGLPVVCQILMAGSTTDFAPLAEKLKQCNADSVMFINSPGVSGGLMRTATSLGVHPLWSHNNGSLGEPEVAQIGSPTEGMLLAAPFPTYRDNQAGVKQWVKEMTAAGSNDPTLLKPNGFNSWLAVHAIAKLAQTMKGDLTAATLTAAMRATKKPIDLYGLVSWVPGLKGPAAFPRFSSVKVNFLIVKGGQEVAYPGLKSAFVLKLMHYVR